MQVNDKPKRSPDAMSIPGFNGLKYFECYILPCLPLPREILQPPPLTHKQLQTLRNPSRIHFPLHLPP